MGGPTSVTRRAVLHCRHCRQWLREQYNACAGSGKEDDGKETLDFLGTKNFWRYIPGGPGLILSSCSGGGGPGPKTMAPLSSSV